MRISQLIKRTRGRFILIGLWFLLQLLNGCSSKARIWSTQVASMSYTVPIYTTSNPFSITTPAITPIPKFTKSVTWTSTATPMKDRWIPNGLYTGMVNAIAIDPISPATVYIATSVNGIYKSTDDGRTWKESNGDMKESYTTSLVVDPNNPSNIYVGVWIDGVIHSSDGGNTWEYLNNGLSPSDYQNGEFGLAVSPQSPTTLFLGADSGIFTYSTESRQWISENSGVPDQFVANSFAFDPKTPTTIYVGASKYWNYQRVGMVLKSINGGKQWKVIKSNLWDDGSVHVAIDPIRPNILFFGLYGGVYIRAATVVLVGGPSIKA
jgi:hypothetical protein